MFDSSQNSEVNARAAKALGTLHDPMYPNLQRGFLNRMRFARPGEVILTKEPSHVGRIARGAARTFRVVGLSALIANGIVAGSSAYELSHADDKAVEVIEKSGIDEFDNKLSSTNFLELLPDSPLTISGDPSEVTESDVTLPEDVRFQRTLLGFRSDVNNLSEDWTEKANELESAGLGFIWSAGLLMGSHAFIKLQSRRLGLSNKELRGLTAPEKLFDYMRFGNYVSRTSDSDKSPVIRLRQRNYGGMNTVFKSFGAKYITGVLAAMTLSIATLNPHTDTAVEKIDNVVAATTPASAETALTFAGRKSKQILEEDIRHDAADAIIKQLPLTTAKLGLDQQGVQELLKNINNLQKEDVGENSPGSDGFAPFMSIHDSLTDIFDSSVSLNPYNGRETNYAFWPFYGILLCAYAIAHYLHPSHHQVGKAKVSQNFYNEHAGKNPDLFPF